MLEFYLKLGRPKVEQRTVVTKTVEMTLNEDEASTAVKEYLLRHYAEFRGMDIQIAFNGIYSDYVFENVFIKATRVKES